MKTISENVSVIIIPAFEPDQILIDLIFGLIAHQNCHIILVNDGSGIAAKPIFDAFEKYPQVTILCHVENQGKGQALKTAFRYFLDYFPKSCRGVITADADGQHTLIDIVKMSETQMIHPEKLILGVRGFEGKVPFRSRFGNQLTRYVFWLFFGKKLKDTQTGLRAIPRTFLAELLKIPTCGYEFELEMLIKALRYHVQIEELPIDTIYLERNTSSHFKPLLDSLRIYFVFLRIFILRR